MANLRSLPFDEASFLRLLGELVGLTERLQNSPSAGLVPEEALAADAVLRRLAPHVASGFVRVERVTSPGYERRPSLVLVVEGTGSGHVGFVGAHFDVVPADRVAEGWLRDPFALTVTEDGLLYGRGVTDCLGHVALLTELIVAMAEAGLRASRTLKVVMISNEEEAALPGCGLDLVLSEGHLDSLRGAPVYWVDSADFGPTLGTGGLAVWELESTGVAGHSGLAQNCVNALELGMATSLALAAHFAERFPPHPEEQRWGFVSASTLKATVVQGENSKVTKIPGRFRLEGDLRLTPFYELAEARAEVSRFIEALDARLERDDAPAGFPRTRTVAGERGRVALRWKGEGTEGVACTLDSEGRVALSEAIRSVRGEQGHRPYAMTGSLPLVRALQRAGADVQIVGFGLGVAYHAPNEHAKLQHFREGFQVLAEVLDRLT